MEKVSRAGVDWDKVRMEYVIGTVTYAELARKYRLSRSTIQKEAQEGDWRAARTEYRERIYHNALERVETQATDASEETIRRLRDATKMLIEEVNRFTEAGVECVRDLRELAQAAKVVLELSRDVYAVPNAVDAARIQHDAARIEIARKAAEKQDGEDTFVIRLDGGLKELAK
jgi:hypothetical protein